jgi:phosphoribosylamine--glycine ligase
MTFHAGTRYQHGELKTSGGRVLCVTGLGGTPMLAQQQAYRAVDEVKFRGMQFRSDIGCRAINKYLSPKS